MCGIAGLFFKRKPDRSVLGRFAQAVQVLQGDRGPDDFGVSCVTDRLYFFHNRLAIIDPGRARQPMQDDRGVITYNGEVYNFAELRFPDETYWLSSDTEVLLKGLNREGVRFLQRTQSMFGLGYYNRHSGELLLARDRVGIKQVYYIDTDEVFAFASTLKPLMQFSAGETDGDAVFDYYLNRAIKAPRTLFRDIHELAPGTVLRFDTRVNESRRSGAGGSRLGLSGPDTTRPKFSRKSIAFCGEPSAIVSSRMCRSARISAAESIRASSWPSPARHCQTWRPSRSPWRTNASISRVTRGPSPSVTA